MIFKSFDALKSIYPWVTRLIKKEINRQFAGAKFIIAGECALSLDPPEDPDDIDIVSFYDTGSISHVLWILIPINRKDNESGYIDECYEIPILEARALYPEIFKSC